MKQRHGTRLDFEHDEEFVRFCREHARTCPAYPKSGSSPRQPRTLTAPSPHPHRTLTAPSPRPHHTLTSPAPLNPRVAPHAGRRDHALVWAAVACSSGATLQGAQHCRAAHGPRRQREWGHHHCRLPHAGCTRR
jgi:hypothetical protein